MSKKRSARKQRSKDAAPRAAKQRRSRRGRFLWLIGVAILAAGVTVYTVPVMDRLEAQRTEVEVSTAELDELLTQNADLQVRLDSLNTPLEIERLARERLGYVRQGETAFVVVTPVVVEEAPPVPEEGTVSTSPPGPDPWYKEWWGYLSGSDLADNS